MIVAGVELHAHLPELADAEEGRVRGEHVDAALAHPAHELLMPDVSEHADVLLVVEGSWLGDLLAVEGEEGEEGVVGVLVEGSADALLEQGQPARGS